MKLTFLLYDVCFFINLRSVLSCVRKDQAFCDEWWWIRSGKKFPLGWATTQFINEIIPALPAAGRLQRATHVPHFSQSSLASFLQFNHYHHFELLQQCHKLWQNRASFYLLFGLTLSNAGSSPLRFSFSLDALLTFRSFWYQILKGKH